MEEFVRLNQVVFPANPRVETWSTMEELLAAIDAGDVPKGGKSLLLRRDLPNLQYWVGRPVGFGRPQFKRYKADLRNQTQPLSSWIVPAFEEGTYEAEASLISATNQEGARQVADIFGGRAFNYAKPVSLLKGLLSQATLPSDAVLDFFAGSGTTGQAVLELNAEDGGRRRFILCSSTEATSLDPDKNLCRDVCAERIRRVIAANGYDADFAYLHLDKLDPADARLDASHENALQLLAMRYAAVALPVQSGPLKLVAVNEDLAVVYLESVDAQTIEALIALPYPRLAVYSSRPATVAEKLAASGKTGNCYSIADAIVLGQAGERA